MIKAIKGTKDIFYDEIPKWKLLENIVRSVMEKFHYSEIRTPVFEETSLFSRSIGTDTDIVSKEMYTFTDRSGISLTLKPEMTASVMRAVIEHSLNKKFNLNKLYYLSPMFRQERPQAGRLRQFHQFGAEAVGSRSPLLDAEMIIIAYNILKELGLKNLIIKINSLGVPSCRETYKKELRKYLTPKYEQLSPDSKKRFENNILRILDSKNEIDQQIIAGAPILLDQLDENSLIHFEKVKNFLDDLNIPYKIDPKLVRGLDYYTNTTFEISSSSVGAQSALVGGGRYDLLVEQLGGKPTPGVGFAAGIERILLACQNENLFDFSPNPIDLYVIALEKQLAPTAFKFAAQFRLKGLITEIDYLDRSLKAQMRDANRLNAKYVLMIGGEEFKRGNVVLKNMSTSEQKEVNFSKMENIISLLQNKST